MVFGYVIKKEEASKENTRFNLWPVSGTCPLLTDEARRDQRGCDFTRFVQLECCPCTELVIIACSALISGTRAQMSMEARHLYTGKTLSLITPTVEGIPILRLDLRQPMNWMTHPAIIATTGSPREGVKRSSLSRSICLGLVDAGQF